MTPIAVILLIILLILGTVLILGWFVIKGIIDWDQEDEALLCDSYKEMMTTQQSEVDSNPGKI